MTLLYSGVHSHFDLSIRGLVIWGPLCIPLRCCWWLPLRPSWCNRAASRRCNLCLEMSPLLPFLRIGIFIFPVTKKQEHNLNILRNFKRFPCIVWIYRKFFLTLCIDNPFFRIGLYFHFAVSNENISVYIVMVNPTVDHPTVTLNDTNNI